MAIEHISDTARWVAIYRAMETDRPDAIFRDPFARRLAGAKGEDIVRTLPRAQQMAWPMIVRTAVFDELIMSRIHSGVDCVLNLAAGLDARPWRLDLPKQTQWIDADLPGILQYKVDQLRNEPLKCRYEPVMIDLRDVARRRALFLQVASRSQRVLVVTEGLLIYLEPTEVTELGRDLHAQPNFRWWLIDIASPRLLKMMQKMWGFAASQGNAPFKFAPAESTAFFQPTGWREAEFRPMGEEARRLNRMMRGAWFFTLLAKFSTKRMREQMKRFSGITLLERS